MGIFRRIKDLFKRESGNLALSGLKNFSIIDDRSPEALENERIFDEIEPRILHDKIQEFKKQDLQTLSQEQLSAMISAIIPRNHIVRENFQPGAPFYRARSFYFDGEDESVFYKYKKDVWYPPSDVIKSRGRLNDMGQPMLYTALDARTPIYEIRSLKYSQFALMKYVIKPKQYLQIAEIGGDFTDYEKELEGKFINYKKHGVQNWSLIKKFISDEFGKRIPEGKDYLYRTTIEIAKKFDFPGCDGFRYRSIEGGTADNVVLKPGAVDRALDFAGLAYIDNDSYKGGKMKKGDLKMWQKWAAFMDYDKIVYAPLSPCALDFDGLKGPIAEEIDYYTQKRKKL